MIHIRLSQWGRWWWVYGTRCGGPYTTTDHALRDARTWFGDDVPALIFMHKADT